jgi:hypothetical protein
MVTEPTSPGAAGDDGAKTIRLQRMIAFLVIVVSVLLFFLLPDHAKGWQGVHDLLPETVIACLAFLVVRTWLFKDDFEDKNKFMTAIADRVGLGPKDELVDEIAARVAQRVGNSHGVCAVYHGFETVPWTELIGWANRVEVVGRYASVWFHHRKEPLTKMLDRGGTLRACLADPEDKDALKQIGRQMSPGSEKSIAQVREGVVATVKAVKKLAEHAVETRGVVELRHADRLLNASWVRLRGEGKDMTVFAAYDHWMPDGPRQQLDLIDLNADPEHRQADYLDYEWRHLWKRGRPVELAPAVEGAAPAEAR